MSTWIIDAGHEGMSPGGLYMRRGKQSPEVPPGIYEGEFTHDVAERVVTALKSLGFPCVNLSPGPVNIPLKNKSKKHPEQSRIGYSNQLHARIGNCRLVSIHANASPDPGWSDANGMRTFVSPRASSTSEKMARLFQEQLVDATGFYNRGIKEMGFDIIDDTSMPAVILEIGFMTNKENAEYLASETGRATIARAIFNTIIDLD